MAVIVNGDGILTGVSSLTTALDDLTSGRGTVTGVATVGTLQLGTGVSMSSPRSQQAAIFTNNTEFFTVDDAGRVGVGTITPNSDAHPQNVGKINVGFITARSVAGDIDANTMVVAGISTFISDVNIADKIIHSGDSNTAIRFPSNDIFTVETAGTERIRCDGDGVKIPDRLIHLNDTDTLIRFPSNDTFSVETAGDERLRINSTGLIGIGTDNPTSHNTTTAVQIHDDYLGAGVPRLRLTNITSGSGDGDGFELQLDGSNLDAILRQRENADIILYTNNAERLRIKPDGKIGQGATSPSYDFHSYKASGTVRARLQTNGTSGSDYADVVVQAGGGNYIQSFIYGTGYGYMNGSASQSMTYGNIANAPVYFSTNNTSRALFDTSGNLNILDGNLIVANGHGIDFSATNDASGGTSELLDDYEEGTWTPAIVGDSGSVTSYYNQEGAYTKIGRLVKCHFRIRVNDAGNATGAMRVTGLPFTVGDTLASTGLDGSGGPTYWAGQSTSIVHMTMTPVGNDNIAYIYIATGATATMTNLTHGNAFGGGWDVRAELMYFT